MQVNGSSKLCHLAHKKQQKSWKNIWLHFYKERYFFFFDIKTQKYCLIPVTYWNMLKLFYQKKIFFWSSTYAWAPYSMYILCPQRSLTPVCAQWIAFYMLRCILPKFIFSFLLCFWVFVCHLWLPKNNHNEEIKEKQTFLLKR